MIFGTTDTKGKVRLVFPFLLMVLYTFGVSAQERLAQIEYIEAEEAYQEGNYSLAIEHLRECKSYLGKTNQKVLYLEIKAHYGLFGLTDPNPKPKNIMAHKDQWPNLGETLMGKTKNYIDNYGDTVPLEKLKEIYGMQQMLEFLKGKAVEIKVADSWLGVKTVMEAACSESLETACNLLQRLSSTLPEMVFVEGGRYLMGRRGTNKYTRDEKPPHWVQLSDYYIGKYEVTLGEYLRYCEATGATMPRQGQGGDPKLPVTNVSWEEAHRFCSWLSEQTGEYFRLPTEAEWEYAAVQRMKDRFIKYSGSSDVNQVAWWLGNSDGMVHPVGQKRPNGLGIHDMSGNVAEWCFDWYHAWFYMNSPEINPAGPAKGSPLGKFIKKKGYTYHKVIRGGSYSDNAEANLRTKARDHAIDGADNIGFRIVMVP